MSSTCPPPPASPSKRLPWGPLVGILGLLLGLGLWASGLGGPSPEEDPNWVPLIEVQQLQAKLDAATAQHQKVQQQIQTYQQQLRLVQQSQTQLSNQIRQSLSIEQIPEGLRAANAPLTAAKIERFWTDQQRVTPQTVEALLQLLVRILDAGLINTTQPADSSEAQQQYRAIQTVLRSIGLYDGAVTGEQKTTFEALTRFQKAQELKVDGKMGLKTFGAIAEAYRRTLTAQGAG